MLIGRTTRALCAFTLVAVSVFAGSASASTGISSGSAHCIVTARPVHIDQALQIWGTAVVQCDVAAVVKLEMRVVEMDGTIIDPTTVIATRGWNLTLTANTPVVIATNKVACVNTEPSGEEFSTRAKLSMFGLTSATDYTTSPNDAFPC